MSDPEGKPAPGQSVNLPDGRKVAMFPHGDDFDVEFTNGERQMALRLSREALDALMLLYFSAIGPVA